MFKNLNLKKFFSVIFCLVFLYNFCVFNCFAMKPNRYGSFRFGPPQHFIGPPVPPKPHTKYNVIQNRVASFSQSWLNLGIDISAAAFTGGAVGKKAVEVCLSKIGDKGRSVILSSIMRAYGSISGIESVAKKAILGLGALRFVVSNMDDLNKHGVRFTVYVTYETHAQCTCNEKKDHGPRQLFPHLTISVSTY